MTTGGWHTSWLKIGSESFFVGRMAKTKARFEAVDAGVDFVVFFAVRFASEAVAHFARRAKGARVKAAYYGENQISASNQIRDEFRERKFSGGRSISAPFPKSGNDAAPARTYSGVTCRDGIMLGEMLLRKSSAKAWATRRESLGHPPLPNNATCNNWLQGAGPNKGNSGLQAIQDLLQSGVFGHGTVNLGNTMNYTIWAFSGETNADKTPVGGLPLGVALTVNDVGGFFNASAPNSPPYNGTAFLLPPRDYPGNTLKAQAGTLIHEVAHQITAAGFQPDFGNPKAERANSRAVDTNCRQLIEGLQ